MIMKKMNIFIIALLITLNLYGAIVISTYKKPREIKYKYKLTDRGKVLIVPKNIIFDFTNSNADINKYNKTIEYIENLTSNTNIIQVIIEGHIDNNENMMQSNTYTKKDILFLYNRKNIDDLSYKRSRNVYLAITNGKKEKLTNYGLRNLINEYKDNDKNRRAEFIIIENTNDLYVYSNYIHYLVDSNKYIY